MCYNGIRDKQINEKCPICGSNKIETEGNKLISGVVINSNTFKRVCRCGFNIEIKE